MYYIKRDKYEEYRHKLDGHVHIQNKGDMIIAQQITEDKLIRGILQMISH